MVQWLRLCTLNAGGTGSIPGQGTRSHMLQLKILHASTKTQCSQINKLTLKKKRKKGNETSKKQGNRSLGTVGHKRHPRHRIRSNH